MLVVVSLPSLCEPTKSCLVLVYQINTHLSVRKCHGKDLATETLALKRCLLAVNNLAGEVVSSATYGTLEMVAAPFLQVATPLGPCCCGALCALMWGTHCSVSG